MTMRTFVTALAVSAALAGPALAQQPPTPQLVRGTVDKLDGGMLTINQGEGPAVTVKLLDNYQVYGVKAAALADVKQGDFIGVGAMPQPDGSQKAMQVTIFAESQRGTGEGFRPWDKPGTTMTNGTADSTVASVDGQVVMVKYKDGTQKIVIGPDANIREYVPGTKDELKSGAHVSVFRPAKGPDGTLQTSRVTVGLGGMEP